MQESYAKSTTTVSPAGPRKAISRPCGAASSLLNVVSVLIQPTSMPYHFMATPTFHNNILFLLEAHHHLDLPQMETSANFHHHEGRGDRYGMAATTMPMDNFHP